MKRRGLVDASEDVPFALNADSRESALRSMESGELDVLVVGGGVVGAGTALDAASRGLRTGLVEAKDFASGTSSRSSKLIHGGLRYLEQLNFRLVREALHERGLLLDHVAPHLVRPVSFLYPLTHRAWERVYAGSGIALYDLMAMGARDADELPHHRHLTRQEALRVAPALRADALVGAIMYYDAQVDDARFTMTLARTAATYGTHVASRARVTGFERTGERVTGTTVRDLESGREFSVAAKRIISATGVWTNETEDLAGAPSDVRVRASKGVHLIVPRDRLDLETGLILRTEQSVLFVIPWDNHWIIGTTDTDFDEDKDRPVATEGDVEYLLEHVNAVLTSPLARRDVEGVYAGLRPLLSGAAESTTKLSREHSVSQPVPGLVVVAGGKYTTYRVMAQDAVDEAVRGLGAVGPSRTADIALVGATDWAATWSSRRELSVASGHDEATVEHLLLRYGSLTPEVIELVASDRRLAELLDASAPYILAEVHYAVTHEGALHLSDVLARRTHVSIETPDHGLEAARVAGTVMAPLLGWNDAALSAELAHYDAAVTAEWASISAG